MLSSIPPCALFMQDVSNECKQLYVYKFGDSGTTITQRAKISVVLFKHIPIEIKTELYFCDNHFELSPIACVYYLQFLCYSMRCIGMTGETVLYVQQLTEVVNNTEQLTPAT